MWGAKRPYNSFGHIHESLLRILKSLGKEAYWVEKDDDVSGIDFENTLFMTQNCVYPGVPQRKDCFYVVHNMQYPSVEGATDHCGPYFEGLKSLGYNVHRLVNKYSRNVEEIGPQIFFEADSRTISFRWGTDLLPHEIDANKPVKAFNSESRVFNYVGSLDDEKARNINRFAVACKENGIEYCQYGGFSGGPILSIVDHVRLIKESYLTPAFHATGEIEQGWISDRLIKNISYGQMGLTCSKYVNEFFNNRLVFNTDAYQLFYDAKERLSNMPVKELHDLMDIIAKNHTYLNAITGIEQAVRALEN